MNCGVSCRFSGTSCFFVIGCLQFLPITDADNTPTRIYADEEQRRLRTHGCGADAVGALSWRQTVVRPLREKPPDALNSHARNIPYLTNPTNELIDQISHEALNGVSCSAGCRGWQFPCFPTDSLSSPTVNHPALFIICTNLSFVSPNFTICIAALTCYVSSGGFELQSTVDKYFALRDGDRLCDDAWVD